MVRNSEGKIVDGNGVEVFKSDTFKGLSSVDNLVQVCPNTTYLDKQTDAAYVAFPEECRKFVEFHSSKLLDDNFSLASDATKHNEYINNVICFLALTNKLSSLETEKVKNDVVGGVFPTKNDNSADSMVPMYLCVEMLKAKCLTDANTPINSLDNYDVTPQSTIQKNSTLGQEFDKVIEKLKQLDYDKSYFSTDMSSDSMGYLSACQIDPSGMVDIFAKCEDDKCMLYVTQGENVNSIPMFTVEKKNEVSSSNEPVTATPEIALPNIPAIETPVTTAPTNTVDQQPAPVTAESTNIDINAKKEEEERILKKLEEAKERQKQVNEEVEGLYAELHSLYESMFKKTPFEEDIQKQNELNSMATETVQTPEISLNAAMFK